MGNKPSSAKKNVENTLGKEKSPINDNDVDADEKEVHVPMILVHY